MIVHINSKISFLQETCIRIQDSQYSVTRNHSGLWTHSLTLTTSPHSMRTILVLIHPEELTYMYNMREDARLKKYVTRKMRIELTPSSPRTQNFGFLLCPNSNRYAPFLRTMITYRNTM